MTIDEAIQWAGDNYIEIRFNKDFDDTTTIAFYKDNVYYVIPKETFIDPFIDNIFIPAIIALKEKLTVNH